METMQSLSPRPHALRTLARDHRLPGRAGSKRADDYRYLQKPSTGYRETISIHKPVLRCTKIKQCSGTRLSMERKGYERYISQIFLKYIVFSKLSTNWTTANLRILPIFFFFMTRLRHGCSRKGTNNNWGPLNMSGNRQSRP